MASYSTIKVDNETYARLLKCRLKAQSRVGRDLSLTETISLMTQLAENSSTPRVTEKEFREALEKFCSEMKGIEAREGMELRKALGAIDA